MVAYEIFKRAFSVKRVKREMELLINFVVNYLVKLEIIEAGEVEIYYFGIREGILLIFNIIFTLLISFVLSDIRTGILFLICFAPIRCYAGGFHAKTRRKCFYYSIVIVVIALEGIKILDFLGVELLILLFLTSYWIGRKSPVENINKPLNVDERKIYRKKTNSILCLEDMIALLFWRICPLITNVVVMAQMIELVLIFMAKRKGLIGVECT